MASPAPTRRWSEAGVTFPVATTIGRQGKKNDSEPEADHVGVGEDRKHCADGDELRPPGDEERPQRNRGDGMREGGRHDGLTLG